MRLHTIILKLLLAISVAFCIAWTAGGTFSTGAGGTTNAGGIETLRPTGDGAINTWDHSTGSTNYECVDEVTANDSDYVYTATGFEFQQFQFADCSASAGQTITNVTLKWRGRYTSSAAQVKAAISNAGDLAQATGDTKSLTDSWAEYSQSWDINPITSEAWTSTIIDSYTFGLRDAGAGGQTECSQIWLEVTYE